ncbi:SHOCT domain-containing protein [Streptomyces glaucescens]|uniref:SHOCT domain-containing protein n=1 Tax=Streptomyces glaucescens TaxID=1907 RepID=A0A089YR25_STRGA|nr:SHOCT domain-containing protein [Streptomyces glaucescens]AIR96115.1 hypothetical protein SGLAU_00435 [Streptomyces glaucescens]
MHVQGQQTAQAPGIKALLTDLVLGKVPAPEQAPAVAAPVRAAPPAARPSTPVEQLRQPAELRDAGILTEDEFAAKKADILARM